MIVDFGFELCILSLSTLRVWFRRCGKVGVSGWGLWGIRNLEGTVLKLHGTEACIENEIKEKGVVI